MLQTDTLLQQIDSNCNPSLLDELFTKDKLYQLLLLDDIFIGIDSSNRLPFLRLLSDYFASYQIILLTYDRNWYNLARTYLTGNVSQEWITKENK